MDSNTLKEYLLTTNLAKKDAILQWDIMSSNYKGIFWKFSQAGYTDAVKQLLYNTQTTPDILREMLIFSNYIAFRKAGNVIIMQDILNHIPQPFLEEMIHVNEEEPFRLAVQKKNISKMQFLLKNTMDKNKQYEMISFITNKNDICKKAWQEGNEMLINLLRDFPQSIESQQEMERILDNVHLEQGYNDSSSGNLLHSMNEKLMYDSELSGELSDL